MINAIKAKLGASVVTVIVAAGGLGMTGTLSASAATPPCGSNCVSLFTQKFGPGYVGDAYQGRAVKDNTAILFQASNTDLAEDFTYSLSGTVDSFWKDHLKLVTPQLEHTYKNDQAVEIEYAPDGVKKGLCLSTWPNQTPGAGFLVRLEPCGQYSNSLWVVDQTNAVRDRHSDFKVGGHGYDAPLINGADASFSDPLVMNYSVGHPTDMPRPVINVQPEATYTSGGLGGGGTVFDSQEWGVKIGPLS